MDENTQQTPIIQEIVDCPDRDDFLLKHTGKAYLRFENLCYELASKFIEKYKGGTWEYIELSNGGFFIMPKDEEHYVLRNLVGVRERVKNQVAGIFITIYALFELSNSYHQAGEYSLSEKLSEKYGKLLDYCYSRLDYLTIKKFID